jgi:heavy metal sensor kinase
VKWNGFQHIRSRLTAWHILVFGGILVIYAVGTFAFHQLTLTRQLDEGLQEDLEILDQLLVQAPEGSYLEDQHKGAAKPLERFLEIWSDDERLLYRSKLLGNRSLGDLPPAGERDGTVRMHSTVLPDGTHWRVASSVRTIHGKRLLVRLAVSEGEFFSETRNFAAVLFLGIPVGLLLVALSGYMMARAALRPIDAMAGTARHIGAQNLKDRVPVKNPNDELGRLALAFNDLLARVEHSFEQLKRFTADASHQLRTPLTAMRSVGEVGLQGEHTPAEYREVIGSMLEESANLTGLVDSLLFLSRADAGRYEIHQEEVDLFVLAQEAVNLVAILAEEKHQILNACGQPGVVITGDRALLRQGLLNLIDNAIKYSPEGAVVTVTAGSQKGSRGWVEVADNGPGIPAADHARVFERFYRADKGAGRGGAGLGLAIVQWAVKANRGDISLKSTEGSGSSFLLSFPLAIK